MAYPDLRVEAAFSVGGSESDYLYLDDPERGLLDTGKLAPAELWVDLTDKVRSATWSRGAQRHDGVYARYEAGTATVEFDDAERDLDPANLSGPYVSAGVTQVRPNVAVRILADFAGVTYELWRGLADSWTRQILPRHEVAVLQATDAVKVLANFDGTEQSPQGAGEDSGARVHRILDNVGWPETDRIVDTGKSTLQATTLAGNAWTELLLVADSEIGEVYVSGAGKVVFRNRHARMTRSRSMNVQHTFGDDAAGTELEHEAPEPVTDDTQIRNTIRVARAGGTQQSAEDTASQQQHFKRTWERNDLLVQTDTEAADYAAFVLYLNKDEEERIESIAVFPTVDPDTLFPVVLGLEMSDRIAVARRSRDGTNPSTIELFVRGLRHTVRGLDWTVEIPCQRAEKFAFMVLDHQSLGRLDHNALAY